MKKLLVFLDELYFRDGDSYISSYAAGGFFKDLRGVDKTYLLPVSSDTSKKPDIYTTSINSAENRVMELPGWHSVISYLRRYAFSGRARQAVRKSIRQAARENDVIWVRLPSLPGQRLAREGLRQGKPVILHFAGDIKKAWKNDKYRGPDRVAAFILSRYMHAKAKRLAAKKGVLNLCTGSALYEMISAVSDHTGFFIDSGIRSDELDAHPYDSNTKRFIYVGRLTEDKGVLDLMNIFESLKTDDHEVRLTIIGFGPEEGRIRDMIKASSKKHIYKFEGYVPNSDIPGYLRENDILVMPSKLSEGFPRVIIEAWAYGITVVSTRIGGIEGLGVDGENIIFSPAGDINMLRKNIVDIIKGKRDISLMQKNIIRNREKLTYEHYRKIVEDHIHAL